MKCEDFDRSMQQSLDDRLRPSSDARLLRHADRCQRCRCQLEAWQRIVEVLPSADRTMASAVSIAPENSTGRVVSQDVTLPGSRNSGRLSWVAMSAAAVVLLAFMTPWSFEQPEHSRSSPTTEFSGAGVESGEVLLADDKVDPVGWWRVVQDRDWVAQTMPAVRSVRDGVAPLGRSLLRAVTILTVGGGDRPT